MLLDCHVLISPFLYLCLSHSLSLCLSLSLSHSLSLYLFSLSLFLILCLSSYLSLYFSISLSLSIYRRLSYFSISTAEQIKSCESRKSFLGTQNLGRSTKFREVSPHKCCWKRQK